MVIILRFGCSRLGSCRVCCYKVRPTHWFVVIRVRVQGVDSADVGFGFNIKVRLPIVRHPMVRLTSKGSPCMQVRLLGFVQRGFVGNRFGDQLGAGFVAERGRVRCRLHRVRLPEGCRVRCRSHAGFGCIVGSRRVRPANLHHHPAP